MILTASVVSMKEAYFFHVNKTRAKWGGYLRTDPKKSVLRTAGNYLLRHSRAGRMNYGAARAMNLSIGSGVIESTIRRVVNLRLKGSSVYWSESTAQDMLLLRCLYKASRWQNIVKQGVRAGKSIA